MGMYDHVRRYPWVLPISVYETKEDLLGSLYARVIVPAEAKLRELRGLHVDP